MGFDPKQCGYFVRAVVPDLSNLSWGGAGQQYAGGVGPFELTLFWAIPDTNINELLAALIAFRLVYFALPASLGMLYLFRPL